MSEKRIYTEKLNENEKDLLELFRLLKSENMQLKLLGKMEYFVLQLKASEPDRITNHLKLVTLNKDE